MLRGTILDISIKVSASHKLLQLEIVFIPCWKQNNAQTGRGYSVTLGKEGQMRPATGSLCPGRKDLPLHGDDPITFHSY